MKPSHYLAIGTLFVLSSEVSAESLDLDPQSYYPIELSCPRGDTGTLILTTKKPTGESLRYWLQFNKGVVESLEFGMSTGNGNEYTEEFEWHVHEGSSSRYYESAMNVLRDVPPYYHKLCNGEDIDYRNRVYQAIDKIRAQLSDVPLR